MMFLIPGILVALIVLICIIGYVKAPPDRAYIITGFRKKKRL